MKRSPRNWRDELVEGEVNASQEKEAQAERSGRERELGALGRKKKKKKEKAVV